MEMNEPLLPSATDEVITCPEPEPSPLEEPSISSAEECDALRRQVEALQAQLLAKDEEARRAAREWDEFHRLFPKTSSDQVPPSVWEEVASGIPLAAAYALYERKSCQAILAAEEVNARNARLSAGRAGTDTEQEFFTRDEVRAMSPAQVRQHYKKIRRSMQSWNG